MHPAHPRRDSAGCRGLFLASEDLKEETAVLRRLLCLHPACFSGGGVGESLLDFLPALRHYPEKVASTRGTGPVYYWDRLLKAELGSAVLRHVSSLSERGSGNVVVLAATRLDCVEDCFQFFPITPLVLLSRDGDAAEGASSARTTAFEKKYEASGYPVLAVRYEDLRRNLSETLTRILDFADLPPDEHPWSEVERRYLESGNTFG